MLAAILDAIMNYKKLNLFRALHPPLVVTPRHVPNTWYHQKLSSFQSIPYQKLSPFCLTG